ncbi:c-type cytochrome [Methylobacterium nodulans]|uniref:Cytochrome c class I n=1 Tax=Methylobacterium nodulans (strain LMG 21967 / CNCM I-2342 / ORS 2060) TaxID=460265 RepID=B8ID42_METNO|nr:c-type cytochrome [Methylobacterium nodulans]ACL59434.1 cytochrome c class I [Methylobacterium nodulans ORS 2060]
MRARLALALLAASLGGARGAPLQAPPGASSCSGCHGPHGEGAFAPLAGRPAEEIAAALKDYRAGTRPATVMTRIAKGFSEEESRAIADYLAQQPQEAP